MIEQPKPQINRLLERVVMVFFSLLATIAIGVTGWTVGEVAKAREKIHKLDKRVVRIEETRFTNYDGLTLENRLREELRETNRRRTP